jgi:type II secretory pathway component PulF
VKDAAGLYRALASLHRAGVAWPQAVRHAARGAPRWSSVADAVERGSSLADAVGGVVDPLDEALIRAGEADGSLESTFQALAERHETTRRQRRARTTALVYPVLVAHVAALLLPLPDLVQGRVGAALSWALGVLVPLHVGLLWMRRADRRLARRVPTGRPPEPRGTRAAIEEADARALDALGRLYDAGVPLGDAIGLAMRAGWGGRAAADLGDARDRVARGEDLAGAWTRLPRDLATRLDGAERAGELGAAARQAASDLAFDAATRRERFARVLPVVVILLLGAVIAWRVLTFYAGVYAGAR